MDSILKSIGSWDSIWSSIWLGIVDTVTIDDIVHSVAGHSVEVFVYTIIRIHKAWVVAIKDIDGIRVIGFVYCYVGVITDIME